MLKLEYSDGLRKKYVSDTYVVTVKRMYEDLPPFVSIKSTNKLRAGPSFLYADNKLLIDFKEIPVSEINTFEDIEWLDDVKEFISDFKEIEGKLLKF